MKNERCQIRFTSAVPPGLEATRSTFPSNELLGYSHASLRDVPRLHVGGIAPEYLCIIRFFSNLLDHCGLAQPGIPEPRTAVDGSHGAQLASAL